MTTLKSQHHYSVTFFVFLFFLILFARILPLSAEEINYKKLYQETAPSVVLIYGTDGEMGSRGTGSVIDQSGLVLTNSHVVVHQGKRWKSLYVFMKPKTVTGDTKKDLTLGHTAEVLAINPDFDLALVQIIKPPADLTVLPLSDLTEVGIGEPTVAIGHPTGGACWTLTTGKISASWKDYGNRQGWDIFQTETSLNPGNSGGPLLDGSGAVVGVNTFIKRQGKDGMALAGLNFAVKSTTARNWIVQVIGKLPPASIIKTERAPLPNNRNVEKAKSPDGVISKPESFFMKNRTSQKRDAKLVEPPKRKSHYTHSPKFKPGTELLASKLEFIKQFRKVNKKFEEDNFFK